VVIKQSKERNVMSLFKKNYLDKMRDLSPEEMKNVSGGHEGLAVSIIINGKTKEISYAVDER